MAAAEQLDTSVEYEIRYFEQGKMHCTRVIAESKKVAYQYYLECGKHNSDLYSIRPDK
ncbi:RNA helicase [Vibrio alginolyticus]|uniref:RNA helicase n=1 Tax=Vibrio TaxID=662 RepID=UPI001559274A|nr:MULTISPECIES: RNA helicase [Vibrio]ELA6638088.1 RNA helicase [Vibrio alginolyticus]ELK9267644.1 RNA helicase [Vibrio alginolyticus]EME3978095.1 RNA helicase [Vibrio alginolyticus]MCR9389733.1 RNA helicase [Vibrio alginolyticus]MDW1952264.1 RNA helicase [Vibrio sp. Vb0562]